MVIVFDGGWSIALTHHELAVRNQGWQAHTQPLGCCEVAITEMTVHGRSRSVHGPFTVGRIGVRRFGTETRSDVIVHALSSDRRRKIYLVLALSATMLQTMPVPNIPFAVDRSAMHAQPHLRPSFSESAEKTGARP